MSDASAPSSPVAGKIGITVLALYLLGVAVRIDGCYAPELQSRDERPDAGPAVGAAFPPFRLLDVSGATIALADLAGAPAVLTFAPSLDWSPPTKARLLDLAAAFRGHRDVRIAVITIAAQDGPRARAFVRDQSTPFYYLVDDAGLTERLGLLVTGRDDTPAAAAATFVLDAGGTVRLRDVRAGTERWLDPGVLLDAVARLG